MTARRLGARSDKSGEIMLWGTAEKGDFLVVAKQCQKKTHIMHKVRKAIYGGKSSSV